MAEFKIIFKEDALSGANDRWERACPLMVDAIQLSRNTETSQAFIQTRIKNISGKPVDAYELQYEVDFTDGDSANVSAAALDADIPSGATSNVQAVPLERGDVAKVKCAISSVTQSDKIWRSKNAPFVMPDRQPLALSEKAMEERNAQLIDSRASVVSEPCAVIDEGDFWICACGQVNVERDRCVRCWLIKANASDLEDERSLEDAADKRAAQKAADEKRAKETRGKAIKFGSIAVAAVTVCALVVNFAVIPMLRNADYQSAKILLENSEYQEAYERFTALGDYSDSVSLARDAAQGMGTQEFEAGHYGSAVNWFEKADDNEKAEQAKFAITLSPFLDKSLEGSDFSFSDRLREKNASLRLNSDGTCVLKAKASWNAKTPSEYSGTWSAATKELIVPGCHHEQWLMGVNSKNQLTLNALESGSTSTSAFMCFEK